MSSFFDEIAQNKLKSILLMAIFALIFFAFMYVIVLLLGGGLFAIVVGGIVIILYAAFSYFGGSKIVLAVSGAKPANRAQYPVLFDVVEGLCSKPDPYASSLHNK